MLLRWQRMIQSLLLTLIAVLFSAHWVQADGQDATTLGRELERTSNQTLLWGPYRPNLYFGVRPRIPKSVLTGLLWARVEDFQTVQNSWFSPNSDQGEFPKRTDKSSFAISDFRHTCEQHEGMAGYGWDEYDVRNGGRQVVHDAGNKLDLQTEFVKVPGGTHGGSWGVRIKGTPRDDAPSNLKSTVVFYAALEGTGNLAVSNNNDVLGFEGHVTIDGSSSELGDFKFDVTAGPETNAHPEHTHASYKDKPLSRTFVHSSQLPEDALWQTKRKIRPFSTSSRGAQLTYRFE
ncbi:MAG: Processing alpha glucosidase I [Sclerophora amabilis]|nr:MAG: Processing alpha glucosidase I [Sclerophora amabilis]